MVTYSTLDWTPLKFGKHEGKTLPQIVLNDPDWFLWALAGGIFHEPQDFEAYLIGCRARSIIIPKPDPENWRVEYYFSLDDKFSGFSIVKAEIAGIESGKCQISSHLDLSYPRQSRPYDKLGNKMMLKSFKHYYFGGSNLTKEKCANFFYRRENFVRPH